MRKIRINNDFTHHWAIELDGAPVDLTALPKRLYLIHPLRTKEIEQFDTNGNIISVELTKKLLNIVGVYSLELHYELPDPTRENGIRYCAVDIRLCQIVPTTEQADEVAEFTTTTDMAFGFQGKSAYDVWHETHEGTLEDYENWLQKPATDAVSLIDAKIDELDTAIQQEEQRELAEGVRFSNEQSRVDAEGVRVSAETSRASNEDQRTTKETARETAEGGRVQAENERKTAESSRKSAESERNENEGLRVDAESLRATAETSRQTAEGLRVDAEILRQTNTQTAITNAEEATENANNAAQNANDARGAIQSDLALKADHGYTGEDTIKTLKQVETDIKNDITNKANHGYDSSPKTLKEVDDEKANHGYASIEVAKTLKQVEDDTSVKMTNLVVNGGFESGVPSWVGGRPILSEEEKLSGDSSGYANVVSDVSYSAIDIVCDLNDKLYISVSRRFKTTSSPIGHPIRISDFGSLANTENFEIFYKGNLDVWETSTFIANGRTNGVRLGAGLFSGSTSQFFVDNFIAVNLTETFGASNEPTKEEFELLLDILGIDYFEGEITIPTQKIMQWQQQTLKQVDDSVSQLAGDVSQKASHGYVSNPKTLKEVEDNPFVPIQMPVFYVYDPSNFRVQSVKSTHKLSGNFTHIKKYNARTNAVNSRSFIVKTADGKYSIAFYNSGYTTRIIVIKNGTTIYDLSQASSTWWLNQGVIIQRTIVDFDSEKIIISYGATNFEVSVAGLRTMKNIEFTDIELGINSYTSPCAYSVLIQGIPASDVDGSKIISYLNTPSTSNLVDVVAQQFRLSGDLFNFENGKVTFDYSTLSSLPTAGNTYTQHTIHSQPNSYSNRLFNIDNIEQSQKEILVRYSFDIDVENASVYFKSVTTTIFKRVRLVNRETFAVIDITSNLLNPFEVPVGKWNMVVSAVAKREFQFGLLLGWGGCNSGAAMTIYQGYRIDPVSVVLSAYPRLASIEKAWCPYSKQFTSELVADFSNDII